jgi:cell division protein FtsB
MEKKIVFTKKIKIIIAFVCVLIISIPIFSDYGIVKRISLEMRSDELKKEISLQKQVTDSLQTTINKLQKDTFEIEKIAREKYGMSKKDEEIFYLKSNKK